MQRITKNTQGLYVLLLILTSMIWGASFVFQRMGADQVDVFTFCGARMTIAAAAVGFAVFLFQKNHAVLRNEAQSSEQYRRGTLVGGLCCGFALSAGLIFQQMGAAYTTAGKAGFISSLSIIHVPAISHIFLHKKMPRITWFAVAMAAVGMYFLCMTDQFSLSKGDALIFLCSIFYALHILCCNHFASLGNPLQISVLQFVFTAAVSWVLAFALETPSLQQLSAASIPVLYCGLFSGGVGYTLQIIALKHVEAVKASLIGSTEAVFAVLFGCLLLHERMSGRELLGCAIVAVVVVVVQLPAPSRKAQ